MDWRKAGPHIDTVKHTPTALPREVEAQVIQLVHELGLVFGCLDFIVTPNGGLVFLEINPGGQWYWLETQARVPLIDCFVNWLKRVDRCPVAA